MSAARHGYGLPDVAVAGDSPRLPLNTLPLLVLVIGLALATIWFVALPAFDRQPATARSCEVYVLESGATRCVEKPVLTGAALRTPKQPGRTKR